ncbi:hypothetical protein SAMN05444352_1261 [Pseudomonas japonica]|uniref:Tetratricopeptide repeat-containing protein n=2 Tax=Pseudomonas japonica TaxID=256466 RepID=A0A239KC76_9PSED|nr:hypothetical protein SAMN05444352_1261 [Pseudomonas japonica]
MSGFLPGFEKKWVDECNSLISAGQHKKALDLFSSMFVTISEGFSVDLVGLLGRLDISEFDVESRENYFLLSVGVAGKCDLPDMALSSISELLQGQRSKEDAAFRQALQLEKANCYSMLGKNNAASFLYKDLASSCEDSRTIAYVYQGLSAISESEDDMSMYAQQAADKHLEAGSRFEAAKVYARLSDNYKSKCAEKALGSIDKAIDLVESERLSDREFYAALLANKAQYLYELDQASDALPVAKKSCDLRRGVSGVEVQLHTSLVLLAEIRKEIDSSDDCSDINIELHDLVECINDEEFHFRIKLLELVRQKKPLDEIDMGSIDGLNDPCARAASYVYTVFTLDQSLLEGLELLDRAKEIAMFVKDKKLLAFVLFSVGELYRRNEMFSEAIGSYEKSIVAHSYFLPSVQACISVMIDQKLWSDLEILLKRRMELIGDHPGICLTLARALFEQSKFLLAYRYFMKSGSDDEYVKRAVLECYEKMSKEEIEALPRPCATASLRSVSLDEFQAALKEFSRSISSKSRMHFWVKEKVGKGYKWAARPEEISKQLLIAFLSGRFGHGSVEILQETRAGAGFIDLYVGLPGGLKVVIELKMCGGSTYSEQYALSGVDQIVHYLGAFPTKVGFLVIFDGRNRDYGKNIIAMQGVGEMTIFSIAVDLRNTVKG